MSGLGNNPNCNTSWIAPSFDDIICASLTGMTIMRTTLALDDDLIEKAQTLIGPMDKTALVREALKALIQRESAKRLALLGGSDPLVQSIPRRQTESA
jgi:Arc/MetJ family transcription regulator